MIRITMEVLNDETDVHPMAVRLSKLVNQNAFGGSTYFKLKYIPNECSVGRNCVYCEQCGDCKTCDVCSCNRRDGE